MCVCVHTRTLRFDVNNCAQQRTQILSSRFLERTKRYGTNVTTETFNPLDEPRDAADEQSVYICIPSFSLRKKKDIVEENGKKEKQQM